MARVAFGANVSGTVNGRPAIKSAGAADEPYSGALLTTLSNAIGVLVADGASPTQAHVTTANTALTAFKAGPTVGDVLISFNTTTVTTKNQVRAAVRAILDRIEGSNAFTG